MTNKQQIPSEELKRINDESIEFSENEFDPGDYRDTAYISYKTGKENEYLRAHSSQPSGQLRLPWQKVTEDNRPKEYTQLLLWFEGLKSMTTGYMINGSWVDENKNHLWCEPDYWAYMPAGPSPLQPSTPTVEQWTRKSARAAAKEAYKSFAGLPSEFDQWFDETYPAAPERSTVEPVAETEEDAKNKK